MGFVRFETEEQCKKAHTKGQGAKIGNDTLVVLYAKKRSPNQEKKALKRQQKNEKSKITNDVTPNSIDNVCFMLLCL